MSAKNTTYFIEQDAHKPVAVQANGSKPAGVSTLAQSDKNEADNLPMPTLQ